jgi:hypothetical protein
MSAIRLSLPVVGGVLLASSLTANPRLKLIDAVLFEEGGAEIVAYTPHGLTLAATTGKEVRLFDFSDPFAVSPRATVDFSGAFGGAIDGVSSTALDPLGRGFGVASLIPSDNGGTLGQVGFYDYLTGVPLGSLGVGYHPDSVLFSKDGSKLFVVNEGEWTVGGNLDAPGSLSIIDLSGVASFADLALAPVMTYDFSPPNLGAGVDYSSVRFNDDTFTPGNEFRHLEPEFATQAGDKLYITLQENNVVAEFDLGSRQWTSLNSLGTILQTIDASDRDGIDISDTLKGLPMPDTIVSYEVAGVTYYITANEGDFRVDDGDRTSRLRSYFTSGNIEGDALAYDYSNNAIGRIRAILDLSDTDGNGKLDDIVVPGTRSFSIWNAGTGELVADSGNFELIVAALDPLTHNMENGDPAEFDGRSDAKGPEPEGLALYQSGENFWLVVGMERQNSLMLYDVTDPSNPLFLDYINNYAEGLVSPESLIWIEQDGRRFVVGGYELSGIGVYEVIPEPSALGFLGFALIGGCLALRRRR